MYARTPGAGPARACRCSLEEARRSCGSSAGTSPVRIREGTVMRRRTDRITIRHSALGIRAGSRPPLHLPCALMMAAAAAGSVAAQASGGGLARLEQELSRLAAQANAKVGIGVIHLETGREVF